jgi:hypothetical protein
MKRYNIKRIFSLLSVIIILNSCSLNLDINENPNNPTGAVVTPDLILTAVIASTAVNQFYYYGYSWSSFLVGYIMPGEGISGYGSTYTYDFTSSSITGAWTSIFADLRDYQTIVRKAEAEPEYALYGGIAHLLKAYSYQLLVDAYGDVPYTEGLQGGAGNVTPAYDDDAEIYKLLVAEVDEAIAILKANKDLTGAGVTGLNKATDPVFSGNITKWIQFANNVKLRLLVRAAGSEIDSFVQSAYNTFSTEGFLKEDVLVNPGYNSSTAQNPVWTYFHSTLTGSAATAAQYYIPSKYILAFYNGRKLSDDFRGSLIYRNYPNTPSGQLGDEDNNPTSPRYVWYPPGTAGTAAPASTGVVKSRTAPLPLFLASETYFLLAEAALTGHTLDGDAKSNLEKGITASFHYLSLEGASSTPKVGLNPTQAALDYIADNAGNYLVDFDAADTPAKKLEAIITQKYIALNIVNANEAWVEFRRTAYPRISGTDAETTFVSIRSGSTRADKLPVRLLHPQAEINLNGANVPKIENTFSAPIFWDKD